MAPVDLPSPSPHEGSTRTGFAGAGFFSWAQPQLPPAVQPSLPSAATHLYVKQLEQELVNAREEVASMRELIEVVPQIFERKFQQRLRPILEDNANLTRQLLQLKAAAEPPASAQIGPAASGTLMSNRRSRLGVRRNRGPGDGGSDPPEAS